MKAALHVCYLPLRVHVIVDQVMWGRCIVKIAQDSTLQLQILWRGGQHSGCTAILSVSNIMVGNVQFSYIGDFFTHTHAQENAVFQ